MIDNELIAMLEGQIGIASKNTNPLVPYMFYMSFYVNKHFINGELHAIWGINGIVNEEIRKYEYK